MFISGGSDGRNLGNDPVGEYIPVPGIIDIHAVVVKSRHRTHDAGHHCHRMRVIVETIDKPQQALVHHRVMAYGINEVVELLLIGQLGVKQQIGNLQETAIGGKLVHRVTAIQQNAFLAIDEGNLALAGSGRHKTRVKSKNACLFVQRSDTDDIRTDGSRSDRQLQAVLADAGSTQPVAVVTHMDSCLNVRLPVPLYAITTRTGEKYCV